MWCHIESINIVLVYSRYSKMFSFSIFWISDFNFGLIHKTALAYNESSSSLSFHFARHDDWCRVGIWCKSGGWLFAFVEKGEGWGLHTPKVQKLQTSVWVELGPALTERSGLIIVACYFLFAQLFKEAKWSGQCYDSKTKVVKEPWMCKVRIGSRWGHFCKRKCHPLPPYIQGPF